MIPTAWLALFLVGLGATGSGSALPGAVLHALALPAPTLAYGSANSAPVTNFTASIQRMVTLLALSGGGLLAFVWARVALSWFSNDIAKKVQAKDRARDALIGTILFSAAIFGLLWGLAQWVVTGT